MLFITQCFKVLIILMLGGALAPPNFCLCLDLLQKTANLCLDLLQKSADLCLDLLQKTTDLCLDLLQKIVDLCLDLLQNVLYLPRNIKIISYV